MPELEALQQQHQKAEAEVEGDAEFRRGLEELVRASCSGTAAGAAAAEGGGGTDDEEAEAEGVVRRRRRADRGGEDEDEDGMGETSAARRRRRSSSRIQGRWAARQAQEMITTMERRNRESELMALAGLHTVSMLDSSFLRESRVSRSPSPPPPPAASQASQASALLQMWRELEDEHLLNRARDRLRGGGIHGRGGSLRSGQREMGESRRIAPAGSSEDASESENDYSTERGENRDDRDSSREQSPDIVDNEGEHVRQIVRSWVNESRIGSVAGGGSDRSSQVSHVSNNNGGGRRGEWMGETERERVRLVREWVQMASQRREARASRREERREEHRQQAERERDEHQPEHVRRERLRLRGRQEVIDLLVRIERERQRELEVLLEHRAVSAFAHRSRIQVGEDWLAEV